MNGQDDGALPLFERWPGLRAVAPRMPLAILPTPLVAMPSIGAHAWIKRDDVTGSAYGGNKVRKLEFLLARARDEGAERLITIGAIGSHHALATTVYGTAAGFDVTAVLLPQPVTDHVRSVLSGMIAAGADVRVAARPLTVPLAILAARVAHRAQRMHTIPAGGSDAVGTLGYVNAALEFDAQRPASGCPEPAEIHVAGGTLGTAAGLAVGCALAGLRSRIVAHRITVRAITNEARARRLVDGVLALLRRGGAGSSEVPTADDVMDRLTIAHGQIGRGYGHATPAAERALERFAAAGIDLDLTYTAKAAAGFLGALEARPDEPRLYWHTLSAIEPANDLRSLDAAGIPDAARRFLQPFDRSEAPL